ncbi:uncharacterized protein C8Q71DRAFT_750631 [Rhodofomes roseus]|uniref:Uncharacterized protein n=1 Tax=Rhodofomes roseus TaxID=34475 RepID=A0ABQ8KJR7_9APHY|nr:uncharacterized protein C8Q71DRAFT_750631 [Rhodofomes roseus]KAH9838357.1 hypothetical protein C8Q71DRAFT_750631 [Rhodofomes roseus]
MILRLIDGRLLLCLGSTWTPARGKQGQSYRINWFSRLECYPAQKRLGLRHHRRPARQMDSSSLVSTEAGVSTQRKCQQMREKSVEDMKRVSYIQLHLPGHTLAIRC